MKRVYQVLKNKK